MNNGKQWVTCAICGNNYVGKVPPGGDGTLLIPRKHSRRIGTAYPSLYWRTKKEVCPGSYRPGKQFEVFS